MSYVCRKGKAGKNGRRGPTALRMRGKNHLTSRPVVIGSGPAGLFCAYLLALKGYRPLLVERGASVHERKKDVDRFWETGVLTQHPTYSSEKEVQGHFPMES